MNEIVSFVDCPICGKLMQTRRISHKPTDEEIYNASMQFNEDHKKLHEIRKIEAKFEKVGF